PTTTPPTLSTGCCVIGTSLAAPLWAAFTALANQQAQSIGSGTLGYANPLLYTVGTSSQYNQKFNDISGGNNSGTCPGQGGTSSSACNVPATPPTVPPSFVDTWTLGTGPFPAVTGSDLATGWGTPKAALL